MSDTNAARAAMANESDEPESEPVHSIKATKALAQEIRDACESLEIGEDVWDEVEVNEPDNPESMVGFVIEGDDGRYYDVHITPKELD